MEIVHYTTEDGTDVYQEWVNTLRDNRAKVSVLRRVDRAARGNFGDHKACRDGVSEMRVDVGPGYRVYYSGGSPLRRRQAHPECGYQQGSRLQGRFLAPDKGGTAMNKPYISHEEATIESFKKNPDYAAEYLNAVIENGDQEELMLALRRVASAFGMRDVAETAQLNPKTLYRTLSPAGNPELRSFQAILGAMGMRLAVTPLAREQHS